MLVISFRVYVLWTNSLVFINIIFLQVDNRISELIISSIRIIIWGLKFSIAT
jgi:hypothetical protein